MTRKKRTSKLRPGKKFDSGKLRISIVPYDSLEEVLKVAEFGAKKYGDLNYRNGMPVTKYVNAAFRHVFLEWLFKGVDFDGESGLSHLAHGIWNLMAALEQMKHRPDLDDRYRFQTKKENP